MSPLEEARQFLRDRACGISPRVALVLGSGLGGFAEELPGRVVIPYSDIPYWPAASSEGHSGKLVLARVNGVDAAVMSGRPHLYEGLSAAEVVFPIRTLGSLGARILVQTNAAGAIDPAFERGGLVLISDHINLQGANPLTGPNDGSLGPRFPDMSEAYPARLRQIARRVAAELGIALPEAVYAAVPGPSYETPAEIRFLRTAGAGLVGMSTVPETIAANHMGLEVLAISCVTNMAAGLMPRRITHREVLETGEMVRGTLVRFLNALLPRLEPA